MKKFKRIFLKYRLNIASGITILLAFVAVLAIYFSLEVKVTSNDECLWDPIKTSKDSSELYFNKVKENGVAWNAGIRDGDQLLQINSVTLKSTTQAQEILNNFKAGEFADYTVKKKNGEIINTKVYVKKLINFGLLAQSISALIYLLIGFIVYSAKPDGLAQRLFFAIGILSVLTASIVFFPIDNIFFIKFIYDEPLTALIAGSVIIISQVSVPLILLYFVWSFPKQFKFAAKRFVKIIFIVVAAIFSLTGIILAVSIYFTELRTLKWFSLWQNITQFTFMVVFVIAWISLIIQYIRVRKSENRKPVLLFVIAFTFGVLIQFYINTIAPAISDTVFNSPEYYLPIVLIVFVPLTFAYAIFKYQLLDVSIVIRNTIIYGAAMATIAGIYFVVIYLLGQGISRIIGAENQGLVAGVFFLIFAFVFQSTKDKFQSFLTRKFYPEQFAYQKVLIQFSNDVSTVVGTDKILDLTTQTFIDALKINKFGILLKDYDKDVLVLARGVGFINQNCFIEK
ncbi:MAG: PDZ domain-containing protein, partial [Ignavibacteriota bacterium]